VVENDFQIIDFEGDPATSLAERRRKHSPLRDVAGMLVSFGHAIRSALMDLGAERAGHSNRLEPWVRLWEQRTRRVFLDGCAEGVCGAASYPENKEHARALIELISPGRPALAAGLSTRRRPCTGGGEPYNVVLVALDLTHRVYYLASPFSFGLERHGARRPAFSPSAPEARSVSSTSGVAESMRR